MDALLPQFVHNVLKVAQAPCQTVDAGDDQRVAAPKELHQDIQFASAFAARARCLLGADHSAAGILEGGPLDREVLVDGADPSVTVHSLPWLVLHGSRP